MNKHERVWSLQEAKARLSEVIRIAQKEGTQVVTVHGRKAVMIVPFKEEPLREHETGASLVELLERSPLRKAGRLKFGRIRLPARNRKVEL
jgi:prevent-host-death family protein